MTKRIVPLSDYLSAQDAASLLSTKLNRRIDPGYIRKLAKSKKQPVRTYQMGNRLLYNRDDILACSIKERQNKHNT